MAIVIRTKWLPIKWACAMTVFPFIFVRRGKCEKSKTVINHERIHLRQQLELALILFAIVYVVHFAWLMLKGLCPFHAYRNVCFEAEAYANQRKKSYLKNRKWYSWVKYLKLTKEGKEQLIKCRFTRNLRLILKFRRKTVEEVEKLFPKIKGYV